jgi:hypothetical protein
MTLGILGVWRGHESMAPRRVADMTIEDLKVVIAEVVAQQLKSQNFDVVIRNDLPSIKEEEQAQSVQIQRLPKRTKQLPEKAHTATNHKGKTGLPQRTKEEQHARNLAVIELLHEWREEGNEEEERESFENLKKALDEDRLSDRPLFPHK